MPDQWGRPSGQDFLGLSYMLRSVGEMRDRRQIGEGLDALMQDPNAARPEEVSSNNWTRAQERYGQGQEGLARGKNALFEQEVLGAEERMLGEASNAGGVGQYLETFVPRTRQELHAATRLYEQADSQAGMRRSLFERRLAVGAQQGQQLMQGVREARRLHDAGQKDRAGLLLEGASNQAFTRWRYKYNPDTGKLDRLHLSRDEGWTSTGDSLDVSDALKQAEGMTIRDYALGVAGEMASTSEFNRKEIENGGRRAVGAGGEEYRVYPQINLQGFGGRDYLVYDAGNRLVGRFDEQSFPQSGLRFEQQKPREDRKQEMDWGKVGLQAQKIYNDALKAALGDNMVPSPEDRSQAEAEARRMADQWLAVAVGPGVSMDTLAQSRWGGAVGQPVGSVQGVGGLPGFGADAQPGSGQASPPPGVVERLQPGKVTTIRNSTTGEVQEWTLDKNTGIPVLLGRSMATPAGGQAPAPRLEQSLSRPSQPMQTEPAAPTSSEAQAAPTADPDQGYAVYRDSATLDEQGNIWAKRANGQAFRLMRFEPEEVQYGNRTYKNNKRAAYEAALQELGLTPRN